MLVAAMERWAQAPERYPQRQLPIPDLTQANPDTGEYWLWEAGGRDLCVRYRFAHDRLIHRVPPAIEG